MKKKKKNRRVFQVLLYEHVQVLVVGYFSKQYYGWQVTIFQKTNLICK